MEFEKAYCDKVDKIYIDMYMGQGKDNPSITTRLAIQEKAQVEVACDMEDMKLAIFGDEKTPGLRMDVNNIMIYAKSSAIWIKGLVGLITLIALLLGSYITYLEHNHRISDAGPTKTASFNARTHTN